MPQIPRSWVILAVVAGAAFLGSYLLVRWLDTPPAETQSPDPTIDPDAIIRTPDESETPEIPSEPPLDLTPFPASGPHKRPFPISVAGRLLILPPGVEVAETFGHCTPEDVAGDPNAPSCINGTTVWVELTRGRSVIWIDEPSGRIIRETVEPEDTPDFAEIRKQLAAPAVDAYIPQPDETPPVPGLNQAEIGGRLISLPPEAVVFRANAYGSRRTLTWVTIGASMIIVDEGTGRIVYEDIAAQDNAAFASIRTKLQ